MQEARLELGRIVSFFERNNFPSTKAALEAELVVNQVRPIVINQGRIEQLKVAFVESNVLDFWSQWEQIGLNNNELEFFLQVYFCFSNAAQSGEINEELVKSGQAAFKTFIETRAENALPDSDEFQIYFGLPYIPKPHLKSQYAHIFTHEFKHKIQTRMLRFLKQHTDQGSQSSQKQKELIDQLTKKTRRQDSEIRKLEEDYGNILQLSLELMDLLQASVQGEPVSIGADIFERLSARLVSRPTTAISVTSRAASTITPTSVSLTSIMPPPQIVPPPLAPALSVHQPQHQQKGPKSKYDFDRIKRDMGQRGELLQALRLNLTKSSSEMDRMKIMHEYIFGDVLGCTKHALPHHRTILAVLQDPKVKLRESMHRFVNTLASIFPGRSYLANSPLLVPAMEEAFFAETRPLCQEHLLGSLQKLSLRRALQSQMIISGKLIPWLVATLAQPDNLSDYVLEYSAALLMNLCLRTKGRYSLIGQAEQTLKVLTDLLSHESQNFKAYLNGSLYSVLAIQEFKDVAKEIGLDALLSSFMKDDQKDTENYGQLEYIKQQINKPPEVKNDDSDDEDGEEEEDADEQEDFEADLDLGDCLPQPKSDILEQYRIQMMNSTTASSSHILRPTTPGQRKVNTDQAAAAVVGAGRESIIIGESVNIDLSNRSKSEFIAPDADLGAIFKAQQNNEGKENHRPNYAIPAITTSSTSAAATPRVVVQTSNNDEQSIKSTENSKSASKSQIMPDGYRDAFGAKPKIPRTPDLR